MDDIKNFPNNMRDYSERFIAANRLLKLFELPARYCTTNGSYIQGVYNGMEYILSILEGREAVVM